MARREVTPPAPKSVDETRLSEAGEISINGKRVSRGRNDGNRASAPHRWLSTSETSSTFPDGVAGRCVSNSASGRPSVPRIRNAVRVEIALGQLPVEGWMSRVDGFVHQFQVARL